MGKVFDVFKSFFDAGDGFFGVDGAFYIRDGNFFAMADFFVFFKHIISPLGYNKIIADGGLFVNISV